MVTYKPSRAYDAWEICDGPVLEDQVQKGNAVYDTSERTVLYSPLFEIGIYPSDRSLLQCSELSNEILIRPMASISSNAFTNALSAFEPRSVRFVRPGTHINGEKLRDLDS